MVDEGKGIGWMMTTKRNGREMQLSYTKPIIR
jgi:hypothetical protein